MKEIVEKIFLHGESFIYEHIFEGIFFVLFILGISFWKKIKEIYRRDKMWTIGSSLIVGGFLIASIGVCVVLKSKKSLSSKKPIASPIDNIEDSKDKEVKISEEWTPLLMFPQGHAPYEMLQMGNGDFITYTFYGNKNHVWISKDNRKTWEKFHQPVDANRLSGQFLEAGNKLFLAGQEKLGYAKLYYSEDNGMFWNSVKLPGKFGRIPNIIQCSDNSLILSSVYRKDGKHFYAVLLKSKDLGVTWDIIKDFQPATEIKTMLLDSNKILWASLFVKGKTKLYISKDFGETWSSISLPYEIYSVSKIFQGRDDKVYISVEQLKTFHKRSIDFEPVRVIYTEDYGESWGGTDFLGTKSSKVLATHYSSTNNLLYVATDIGLFSSTNPAMNNPWNLEYEFEPNGAWSMAVLNESKDNVLLYSYMIPPVVKKLKK